MSRFGLLLTVAVAATLALPGGAHAGRVLLYGPELDAEEAQKLAKKTLETEEEFEVVEALSARIGVEGQATAVFGAFPKRCTDPPSGGRPIGGVTVMAREEIFNMSYVEALERLDAATTALPCNADAAETKNLYDLFFLRGFAHHVEGRTAEARASFSQAAAIDPSRPWSNSFPPTPKSTYLEALQDLLESEPAPLRVEVGDLILDGRPLERGRPHTVRPGSHLVQAGRDVLWVEVPPEALRAPSGVVVTTAERLLAGLLVGDAAYGPWLRQHSDANGWSDVVLITVDQVLVFDGSGFRATPTAAGLRKAPAPPQRVAGVVLLGVGIAGAGVGLGVHVSAWAEAKPGPDGSALMPREDYESQVARNRAGFGLAMAGAAVAGTGLVLTLVPPKAVSTEVGATVGVKPVVVPWVVGWSDGVSFGVGGRF